MHGNGERGRCGGHMGMGLGRGEGEGRGFGNMYRFLMPVVAVSLAKLGKAHGYQVAQEAQKLSVTDGQMDQAAVYRALRRMDMGGLVYSEWDTSGPGPARRVYMLSEEGLVELKSWMARIKRVSSELASLLTAYEETDIYAQNPD